MHKTNYIPFSTTHTSLNLSGFILFQSNLLIFPFLTYYESYLIVWASVTGSNLSSLHILDLNTLIWKKISCDFIYRQGSCCSILNNILYIFGSTSSNTILTFNLIDFSFKIIQTEGDEPQIGFEMLNCCLIGKTLFTFSSNMNFIYLYETEHLTWNKFSINTNKKFGIPISIFYDLKERKIIIIYQKENKDKYYFADLYICKSISKFNHSLDFLDILKINF